MTKEESNLLLAQIKENRRKLDGCARHLFIIGPPPYAIGMRGKCSNCDGEMSLTDVSQYARGYQAAGLNPDIVVPGWFGNDYDFETDRCTCPHCKGANGIELSPGDWFDCDFCDAQGTVTRAEALVYLDQKNDN